MISARHLLATLMVAAASETIAAPIDLGTWQQEGALSNGNWTVAGDGSNVLQRINGDPTFFVSPDEFLNTEFNGSFGVESAGDNDYIGFVFGYQSPLAANSDAVDDYNFFLFDWKQGNQGSSIGPASEGFNLSHVSGPVTDFSPFWAHGDATSPDADFDVIATDYGADRGWEDNTSYDFDLLYQADRILISITGGSGAFATTQQIFDIAPGDVPGVAEFQSGRFGFYNYSQALVRYAGFTEDAAGPAPTPVSEPSALGLLASALIGGGLIQRRRRKKQQALEAAKAAPDCRGG